MTNEELGKCIFSIMVFAGITELTLDGDKLLNDWPEYDKQITYFDGGNKLRLNLIKRENANL